MDYRAVFPVFVGTPTYLSWLLAELMISSLILISQWVKQLMTVSAHIHSDALYCQVCTLDKVCKRLDTSNLPIILFFHHQSMVLGLICWDTSLSSALKHSAEYLLQDLGVTSASKDFLPYKFIFDTHFMYLPLSTVPRKLAFLYEIMKTFHVMTFLFFFRKLYCLGNGNYD